MSDKNSKYSFSKNNQGNVLLFLLLIIAIAGIGFLLFNSQPSNVVSPLADETPKFSFFDIFQKKSEKLSSLDDKIKKLIEKQTGVYSVYIFDLNNQDSFSLNETMIFTAASVNKIPILAALYYRAQNGQIDLDERITIQSSDIQDYGTGAIRSEGPGGVYSLKTLAQLMMEKSDNTAAYVLSNKIGIDQIQKLINSWGLVQTDMVNNKTSNKDLGLLLAKMYREQITNQAYTMEMLGMLKNSDFENRIPKYLPDNVIIYHKIGSEIGLIHDVGIIESPSHTYYLGILTNDINDETQTEETIAQISKMVYDFLK